MINIKYNPKKHELKMSGHAQFKNGNDIVCASASILCYTLAQNFKDCESRGELKEAPIIRLNSGNARISAVPKEEYEGAFDVICSSILIGFLLLQQSYPENVSIN